MRSGRGFLYLLAGDSNLSSPDKFLDSNRLEQFYKGGYLFFITGHLDRIGLLPGIHDPAPEDLGESQDFRLVLLTWGNLDEHHLTLDVIEVYHIHYFYDIDELVQLF